MIAVGHLDGVVEAGRSRAPLICMSTRPRSSSGADLLRQDGRTAAGASARPPRPAMVADGGQRLAAASLSSECAIGLPDRVHRPGRPAGQPALALGRLEQLGGQHRRQAQRQQGREAHGGGDGHGQLDEQPADIAGQEHQRREHRDQHRWWWPQQRRTPAGRRAGPPPCGGSPSSIRRWMFSATDDGVVDHQADGQHQGQQGQQVQREAQRPGR